MGAELLLIGEYGQQRVYPDLRGSQTKILLSPQRRKEGQKNASYDQSPDVSHVLLKSLG